MLEDTALRTIDQRLGDALAEYEIARERGQTPERQVFLARHPDLAEQLGPLLDACQVVDAVVLPLRAALEGKPPLDVPRLTDYEDLEEIGRGAMGVVYRARQRGTGKRVALKMINPGWFDRLDGASRQEAIDLLRIEARAAACLKHPCTIAILHPGECDGRPYLAMELIEGESLAAHLRGLPAGRLNEYDAARHLAGVAEAVHEAHQRGILHRDLKPGNILLDASGQARVADFGLAKLDRGEVAEAGVRQERRLLGTLPYMSPEQTRDPEAVTPASDVYSLGATLYELLTGRPPFTGKRIAEVCGLICSATPRPPTEWNPNVSRRLEQICLKCLEKAPERRYGSADELARALKDYLNGRLAGWRLSAMGGLFLALAPVVMAINLFVYAMLRGDFVEPLVWACAFSMYPALFAVFLLAPTTRSDLDNYATRKELWFVWGAKMFTAVTISVVLRVGLDIPARETIQLSYACFASLSGMAIFIMARDFRAPIFLLAVVGWLVALGMLPRMEWAPLIYGGYGSAGLVLFGLYERRLGRELR